MIRATVEPQGVRWSGGEHDAARALAVWRIHEAVHARSARGVITSTMMNIEGSYTWFLLCSRIEDQPLVVLQSASSGEWENDLALPPAVEPVGFWAVSTGTLGSVLSTSTGTLISQAVASAISSVCPHEVRVYPAVVAHPRNLVRPEPYLLVRPQRSISIAQLADPPGRAAVLASVQESSADVVVNLPLRLALEQLRLPDLAFEEPCFG